MRASSSSDKELEEKRAAAGRTRRGERCKWPTAWWISEVYISAGPPRPSSLNFGERAPIAPFARWRPSSSSRSGSPIAHTPSMAPPAGCPLQSPAARASTCASRLPTGSLCLLYSLPAEGRQSIAHRQDRATMPSLRAGARPDILLSAHDPSLLRGGRDSLLAVRRVRASGGDVP